jgi:protein TonB
MFDGTLNSSWEIRSHRGLTTLTSVALQMLVVAALLVLPLLRPPGLPSLRQISTPISLGQPLDEPAPARISSGARYAPPRIVADFVFRTPSRIPKGFHAEGDSALPQIGGDGPAITGTGNGNSNGMPNLFGSGSRAIMPTVRPPLNVAPLHISHMSEGNLIRKVQPAYPALARSARIQGAVVLQAVISKDGSIENLRLLSGHPMLASAAMEAVNQWRYRPYILNNEPLEVETQITVNFSLAGN